MVFGLCMLSFALFYMTTFRSGHRFPTAAMARVFQGVGLAFLFVPINTVAYSYLPPEKNNAASGLINLARNVGGSMGISFVTTMLDRRTQFHQRPPGGASESGESARAGDAARHHFGAQRAQRLGRACSRRTRCCRHVAAAGHHALLHRQFPYSRHRGAVADSLRFSDQEARRAAGPQHYAAH